MYLSKREPITICGIWMISVASAKYLPDNVTSGTH
jgi:hypothetical protein